MLPCVDTPFTGRSELKWLTLSGMEEIYENLSCFLENLISFGCFSDLRFNQDVYSFIRESGGLLFLIVKCNECFTWCSLKKDLSPTCSV